jgi:hypothetical protein
MLLDESFRSRWMTFEWAALPTHCGPLDLSVRRAGCDVVVSVRGVEVPPGGIVLRPPIPGRAASVDVNGRPAPFDADGVTIATCPADVVLRG